MNSTVAELTCGSSLGSCTQLTDILTIQDFPTNYYIRLIVDGTTLGCTLEQGLWGPIKYQEILLTNNHFNTLDNHAFTPFNDTLKLLNLEKNSLENVYFPTLSELSHLEVLSLSYNKISFIPSFSPICLNRLRKLKLGYNSIQFLQQRTFADLPSLVYLDLSHNLISELPSEAFTIPGHQSNLVLQIDLAFNAISRVEYGVLDGPTSCVLYLQHNQLETLEQHAFMSIIDSCSTSAMIIVTGNPLTCDQRLCWLVMNETIRASFDDFPCPNLNNNQVDVILPLCQVLHKQL
ncbi:hypothetical protein Pcinc_020617 [Petrolisthes cinctipes]|uniref:Uncharacterized protein n=1 Tax=Petrolisthes cinctipes TaxID=88211 RepID=A0AAE1FI15_PETCI|nr:hypothetical protein Pcinc_020617 [Petrolisthes cinctipes]